jgi:hypothetical protein
MKRMKWIALAVSALALTGCLENQKQQLSECEKAAQHANPGMSFAKGNAVAQGMRQCMETAGFAWQTEASRPAKCSGEYVSEANLYCYAPTGFLDSLNFKLNMLFD